MAYVVAAIFGKYSLPQSALWAQRSQLSHLQNALALPPGLFATEVVERRGQ